MTDRRYEQEVARHWDRSTDAWAEAFKHGKDVFAEVFNTPSFLGFIGDLNGKKVLDAGCGEGRSSRNLTHKGAKVVGVDLSSRMIALAQREEEREPLGIEYRQASFSDLSIFEDGSFETVVSMMALMDAPDFTGAAKEFFRVLRPGGMFAFSVIHPCFYTRGLGYVRDGKGRRIKLTVCDYFADAPVVERWRFPAQEDAKESAYFGVPRFPYTLSHYVNGLIGAGFVPTGIMEPRPSEKACRRVPRLAFWRRHGALYLYVRGSKPE
jgi:2-polyprenyl-3-methyl-5-hydroxy-6-metoxy-1,4-benzoquinol methylase